ncbi:hypothetical protein SNE40_014018 [Patella caerulea]|uniref:Uncharacterized protein n=1 Tax=Patella caerulea TaxID=87958 RepID=A0AAN8PIC4_PATCE
MVSTRYFQLAGLLTFLLAVLFHTSTDGAPLDALDLEEEDSLKRAMFLARLMIASDKLKYNKPNGSSLDITDLSSIPFSSQQKRYRAPMQGRSGGMSLCLWKVCPAAPWLVSKKSIGMESVN